MNEPIAAPRVVAVSGVPLFRLGVTAAFAGRNDFVLMAVAETAEEVYQTVAETGPNVVLVDADLPDADGLETAAALREAYPACGVVLLGRLSDEMMFRALDAGLSAFVPTSTRTEGLLAAVRNAAFTPHSFSAPDLAQALARRDRQRSQLSPRENEVLQLLRAGLSVSRIAQQMMVSESTIKTYVARVYDKLGVRSRAQAVAVTGQDR